MDLHYRGIGFLGPTHGMPQKHVTHYYYASPGMYTKGEVCTVGSSRVR